MRFTTKLVCMILFAMVIGVLVYSYMPVKEGWASSTRSDSNVLYGIIGVVIAMFITFIGAGIGDYYNRTLPVKYNRPITAPMPIQTAAPSVRKGGARK